VPRRAIGGGLLLALVSASAAAQEAAPWPSLLGSGLATLPDAAVPARGRVLAAFTIDNRDRDPLGLDLLDGAAALAVGLGGGLEAGARVVLSRVVAMPEAPAMPVPPVDWILAPGAILPPRPHYALLAATPYVNKRGRARFGEWVKGDALLALKWRAARGGGGRPALAFRAEVTLPLTRSPADLQSGAGTGGADLGLRGLWQWSPGRTDLVASLGITRTGAPALADAAVHVGPAGTTRVERLPLRLPHRLEAGLGARRRLGRRLAAVVESSVSLPVGGRTPVQDAAWPWDTLAGVQGRLGKARLLLALRHHGHALPSGARRTSPLGGRIELTDVPPADLLAFLARLGLSAAAPALRGAAQKVLVLDGPPPAPLPPGARVLPGEYRVRSEHQLGFALALGVGL
jgi:hypothetical protein